MAGIENKVAGRKQWSWSAENKAGNSELGRGQIAQIEIQNWAAQLQPGTEADLRRAWCVYTGRIADGFESKFWKFGVIFEFIYRKEKN